MISQICNANTGLSVTVPSVFRLMYLVRAAQPNADRTWNAFNALIAGKTEGDIGIICACAPCLHVFFKHFFRDEERRGLSSVRGGSRAGSREPSRRRPSVRSDRSAKSEQSTKVVHFADSTSLPNDGLRPGLNAPQVLKWSEMSIDDIPEAYTEDVGRRAEVEKDVDKTAGENLGQMSPFHRPATARSWLNLDADSSDDDRDLTGQWHSDKFEKSFPHR
jgi:hypothetical protein